MAKRQAAVKVIMESSGSPVDSRALAAAFVECLKTDTVRKWADEVQSIIAASRRRSAASSLGVDPPPAHDDRHQQKDTVRKQIAGLQEQLRELERKSG